MAEQQCNRLIREDLKYIIQETHTNYSKYKSWLYELLYLHKIRTPDYFSRYLPLEFEIMWQNDECDKHKNIQNCQKASCCNYFMVRFEQHSERFEPPFTVDLWTATYFIDKRHDPAGKMFTYHRTERLDQILARFPNDVLERIA